MKSNVTLCNRTGILVARGFPDRYPYTPYLPSSIGTNPELRRTDTKKHHVTINEHS